MRFEVSIENPSGYPIIQLTDTDSGTKAEIYSCGGILNSWKIAGNTQVIDGFGSAEQAISDMTHDFKGAKLSPFACRLKNGTYTLAEADYTIDKFYSGKHALHGLLYDLAFSIESYAANDDMAKVLLKGHYNGSDRGYPFPYTIQLSWVLSSENSLAVTTTIQNQHLYPIPMMDGWHPYFTLGESIDDNTLHFNSNQQVVFDDELIPTGAYQHHPGFTQPKSLKSVQLDHCFLLNNTEPSFCILENEQLRLTIRPDKKYPYLQIYTPAHRRSIAIENLSAAPDAYNNGMGLMMLNPGISAAFTTHYQITVRER